jgi:hypothetical protein
MVIVDPLQPGVTAALSTLDKDSTSVIGRIDVGGLAAGMIETARVAKVKAITDAVISSMNGAYDGVLIANWDETITPGIYNELISFLNGINLNVYNEIAAPRFMDDINSKINVDQLAGIVFINGSILPNGERRDYFNLLTCQKALAIVTAQSCLREFAVVMCEIVDDDAPLSNAVMKRSFTWCSYYGAISWIGRRAALKDASVNVSVDSPDGAFEWLKKEKVMDIHEIWRLNSKVRTYCIALTRFRLNLYAKSRRTHRLTRSSQESKTALRCTMLTTPPPPTLSSKLLMSSTSTGCQKSSFDRSIHFLLRLMVSIIPDSGVSLSA